MTEIIIGGKYRHFKGNVYKVLAVAKHSEDLSELVIYERISDKKTWARPEEMFTDSVIIDEKAVPRFELIEK